jgi:maltose alpha-D-glucosyltransferase/alpha-amylase
MVDAMRRGDEIRTNGGATIRFSATSRMPEPSEIAPADVKRLSAEQSNTSIQIGETMVLKIYRRLQEGIHPELEVGRFLTDVAGFENTPPTLGSLEYLAPDGRTTALCILQSFVRNQGDAWRLTLDSLTRELDALALAPAEEDQSLPDIFGPYLRYAEVLGRRTGEMHLALATETDDPAFTAEPMRLADLEVAAQDARSQAEWAFAALARSASLSGEALAALRAREQECLDLITRFAIEAEGAVKTRIHGDFHLGQVLIVQNDVMIVDFEGEPARPADERRQKSSPLRDVAGMLRSFAYAADTASRDVASRFPEAAHRIAKDAAEWLRLTEAEYLAAYEKAVSGSRVWVADEGSRKRLLRLYLLSKALYEINYEANTRPDWIETPVRGVLSILDGGAA